MNVGELAFELVQENFALILSTTVSLFAVGVSCYQTYASKKEKIMSMYFTAQLEAYQALYKSIGLLEGELSDKNIGALVAAGQNAMLVSTNRNAEIISHFIAVFLDYVKDREAGKLTSKRTEEFVEAKRFMEVVLRDELFRYDTMKRRSDKYFKDGCDYKKHRHQKSEKR